MYIKANFETTPAAALRLRELGFTQRPGMRDGWAVWGNSIDVPDGVFQVVRAGNPGMPSVIGIRAGQ